MMSRVRATALVGVFLFFAGTCTTVAASSPASSRPVPGAVSDRFFGIVPQSELSARDVSFMRAGGIGSVRLSLPWAGVQPTRSGPYQWASFDHEVELIAEKRLEVLPFLSGSPPWIGSATALPVGDRSQRSAWTAFVRAAVGRYGPGGRFWRLHSAGSVDPLPEMPIRRWQIWNEPNFFYFASPVSPPDYGRLVKISHRAITSVDPDGELVLAGLFGHPHEPRDKGVPATRFLSDLYRSVPNLADIAAGVALHPYAARVGQLEELTMAMRRVVRKHHDASMPLYITEMGWGSQDDPDVVSFERGPGGQAGDLTRAYHYLLANRRRLRLRQVYWFSWKDNPSTCDFCDSAGLFAAGPGFDAKSAWRAFVKITGGRQRPRSSPPLPAGEG